MIKAIMISLVLGVLYATVGLGNEQVEFFSSLSDITLVILMFSVGISVGANKQVFSKIKEHHIKILLIPVGIILGSILGGVVCSKLMDMPLNTSVAITSGLGWYSLSGVLLTDLAGADVGTIAFLANLFREILSFMIIPIVAKYCNPYTAIAPAAATSEDTTLPVLIKYTSEEVVVMAVINGVICSMMVPILTNFFYSVL
ncbi:lysine exporter LysO family protein [Niameybacter massiliensis]|uniref:Lysine exporter LysO family protein n=1 Tax=Holtiella tumoricola TaxID=3018743 RepID=A0AA42DQ95_9FIRM|nr:MULTISPECIES: lysine exporter LysO family protein [Lachnospirales]MDA3732928.1 lysine exporter LysO family protein [Holtiella tumoricola]